MSEPLHLRMPDTSSEDELTPDAPQVASQNNRMDIVNHPNVPDNVTNGRDSGISSLRTKEELGIVNRAFVPDESDRNQASMHGESFHIAAGMLPRVVGKQQDNFSIPNQEVELHLFQSLRRENDMSVDIELKERQSLSLSDQDSWLDTSRDSFVTQRIRELVLAFADRAQKIKERITRAPTPSPTPPAGDENERNSRPRLQSLIQQEEDDFEIQVTDTNRLGTFWCCRPRRKWTPSFPKILDPQGKVYITWLFFVMLSYVYNAWVIILRAVFLYDNPDNLPIFLVFDYISDLIYLIDIVLFKVRLQFLHDGFWVDDPKKTRKHYFKKTMFKMDVLSLLPLDLLYFIYGTNPLFRLPRFLKIQTFWEFFDRVDAVAKTPYVIRIIRTLLYMMYLIHLNACAYYAMSDWEGIGSNKWVFQGQGNEYIRCFYFATKTATSIGKNPKPENEYEYVFMTISWLMGVFIFAFLIGQIRDIVATATQSKTQYRQLMDQTVMYMRNLNLPEDLQRRVRLWLNHTWEQQKTLNESGILDSLPRKMKTDVAINVHYNTLVKVQLFKDCDKALLRDLVLQLKPVLFLPGDYICRKGEVGKEMYIVNKGLVQVVASSESGDVVLATLSEGSVFGEISLLGIAGCSRRTADVRSQGFSNLFVLSKDDLWEALKNYPEAQEVLKRKARSLIKENEDRDRANKNNTVKIKSQSIIKRNVQRPRTPQLLKTVMKVVPKDSICSQLLERKPSMNKSMHPFKTGKDTIDSRQSSSAFKTFKIPLSRKSSEAVSRTSSSPQISWKDRVPMAKRRSASLAALPYISPPGSYHDLKVSQNVEDKTPTMSPASELDSSLNGDPQRRKSSEDVKDLLKSILSLIPKDFHVKKQNVVHPVMDPSNITEGDPKPNNPNNTTSEDSGISMDFKTQNSANCQQTPMKTQEDCFLDGESDDSELSMMSIKTTAAGECNNGNGTRNKGDLGYHTWVSPSSSVFSLQSLFRTNSSKSSSTTENETSVEPIAQQERKESYRPSSSASDMSSAGYDNLEFVPVDILSSRRSSMYNDDVSC